MNLPDKRRELDTSGCCVIENVLSDEFLTRLRESCLAVTSQISAEDADRQKSTGSMVSVADHAFFAELIAWQPALDALRGMGFDDTYWSSGYLISKPPKSPQLFWHQDAWYWNDDETYTPVMHQLFLMYYLVDTTIENGCLRVIPGSHLKRHPLHDMFGEAHDEALARASDLDNPAFQAQPDEVNVCVKAGDLVIGDARILHAAHPNNSDEERPVITLWYFPDYHSRSEGFQASAAAPKEFLDKERLVDVEKDEWQRIRDIRVPAYAGDAEGIGWNRTPDQRFQ